MKSITSNEALQSSFALANSKTPPFPLPNKSLFTVNPRPSSKFFFTLSSGFAGNFLASAPGNFPLQEYKNIGIKVKKSSYFFNEL